MLEGSYLIHGQVAFFVAIMLCFVAPGQHWPQGSICDDFQRLAVEPVRSSQNTLVPETREHIAYSDRILRLLTGHQRMICDG